MVAHQPIWSKDDIARIIITVGQDMRITERGIVIGLSVGLVESALTVYGNAKVPGSLALPHDAVGSDGLSCGVQQQQVVKTANGYWWGPVEVCQDPTSSTRLFYDRLKKLDYNGPNSPGSYAQAVQGSSFPDRYDERMDEAQAIYDRVAKGQPPVPATPSFRPDFNEYPIWSPNNQDRGGATVDLFLIHTQEGQGTADSLARWLQGDVNASYHYCISEDLDDHGVTVVDVVDTDSASWSVLSANNRSINLCYAGSSASWSRADWMKRSRAIDVSAYIAALDCVKYKIKPWVIMPPYNADPPGLSDHRFVTNRLHDGTHTDVGGPLAPPWTGFPWDVFDEAFHKYYGLLTGVTPPAPLEPPVTVDLLKEVWDQLRIEWPQLGGQTLVNALGEVRDKVCGATDYHDWKAGKS